MGKAHDTTAHMEETQTMNSYYQLRQQEPEDDAPQAQADEPAAGNPQYSGKDLDLYRVLLAVERGELSVEDAARRLEELEAASPQQTNSGPI
jgi:hypothetical protein